MQSKIKYHGTGVYFEKIDLKYSGLRKDFGSGFYLAEDYKAAYEMARKRAKYTGCGYIFSYEITSDILKNLSVRTFQGPSLPWLEFIVRNRMDRAFQHEYDVVIGPIADAKTLDVLDDYLEGSYGDPEDPSVKQKIIDILRQRDYGIQYCFCTPSAIDQIQSKRVKEDILIDW